VTKRGCTVKARRHSNLALAAYLLAGLWCRIDIEEAQKQQAVSVCKQPSSRGCSHACLAHTREYHPACLIQHASFRALPPSQGRRVSRFACAAELRQRGCRKNHNNEQKSSTKLRDDVNCKPAGSAHPGPLAAAQPQRLLQGLHSGRLARGLCFIRRRRRTASVAPAAVRRCCWRGAAAGCAAPGPQLAKCAQLREVELDLHLVRGTPHQLCSSNANTLQTKTTARRWLCPAWHTFGPAVKHCTSAALARVPIARELRAEPWRQWRK